MVPDAQIAPAAQIALETCKDVLSVPWYVLPVGWASVTLAAVSVVPPLISDSLTKNKISRAIWIIVIVTCLYLEWSAISWDDLKRTSERVHDECISRNQFATVGNNLNLNFYKTGMGIQQSVQAAQQSFTAATNSFDKAAQAVNILTGGNSFPYVDFDQPYGQMAVAKKIGKFPIHELTATFFTGACDNMGIWGGCKYVEHLGTKTIHEINMGAIAEGSRGSVKSGPGGISFPMSEVLPPDKQGYLSSGVPLMLIDLTASNGVWREYFWTYAKISPNGALLDYKKSIRIYSTRVDSNGRTLGRNLIWECRSKGFPEKMLGADFFDGSNITYYGHPLHIKPPEEGGIAASNLPHVDVSECN
jgi:hypothetical protein